MCSYNRINGVYSSENNWLLNDVLRKQWGYKGLVMTDWGAINDDFRSRQSGLDLEMPGIGKRYKNLLKGIKKGLLFESDIDGCAKNIIDLNLKLNNLEYGAVCDYDEHFNLARKIAAESSVLLKNSSVLPLKSLVDVAIIGAFAESPRYQGTGSSKVNPYRLSSFLDALQSEGITYRYSPGYKSNGVEVDEKLENEAIELTKDKAVIVVFAGLPDAYESEGFDREAMRMPKAHLSLINRLCQLNKKVIVVLECGAPVEIPFHDQVDAILLTYLAGEAVGPATLDVLLGRVNPSGHLPETWPLNYEDCPSAKYFPGDGTNALYKESIYVGYRYYATAGKEVRYPFGFGLSYTKFAYANMEVKYQFVDDHICYAVSFDLTNDGSIEGKEAPQLYVESKAKGVYKPLHELKGFAKVNLKPHETKRITINLNQNDLKIFDLTTHDFVLEKGDYVFKIGASANDIKLTKTIAVEGQVTTSLVNDELMAYYHPAYPFETSDDLFEKILQDKIPYVLNRSKRPFNKNSTLKDLKKTLIGKILIYVVNVIARKMKGEANETNRKMFVESAMTMPLRGYTMSGLLTNNSVDGLIHMANRKFLRGLWCMIFKR
jgi:beta-glucosidase